MMSIVALALAAQSAPAQSQIVWKWVPNPNSCLLRQEAGNGRFLDVGGRPGFKDLGVSVIDTNARIRSPKTLNSVQLSFSAGESSSVKALLWASRDPIGRSFGIMLDRGARAKFLNASAMTLAHDDVGTVKVPIRSPAAALEAVQTCEDRKMTEWGIDPAAWRELSATPEPATPVEKWFSWLDYPDRAKIYKNDISVVARLDVAADGSVLKCTVVNRPPSEFVPAACNALMKNSKFHPARDAQGRPAPAPYIFEVSFAAFHL